MTTHGEKSKRVRRVLEDNPDILSEMSYRELAKQLGVKKSTVHKEYRKLIAERNGNTDPFEYEGDLEDWLENNPRALIPGENILWIGRQVPFTIDRRTIYPDLLGIDVTGSLVIVELKKNQAPREVVAQILEYAAYAKELSEKQIREIAQTYFDTCSKFKGRTFPDVFISEFDLPDKTYVPRLNTLLRLFIVAAKIPTEVTCVCKFLSDGYRMDISCISVAALPIQK